MLRKSTILIAVALLASLVFSASAFADRVAQGKVLQMNEESKVVVIEEYDTNFTKEMKYGNPTGIQTTFDLASAKVGMKPEVGDILRIAYRTDGSKNIADKVMNVSKQDLRKRN